MPKNFDPDKARKAAEDTIVAAQARKAKAAERLEPFQARVKRAQEALAKAAEKVNEEDALIARQKAFLERAYPEDYPSAPVAEPAVA